VDWFMAQVRAMTNMVGNSVATIIVARWENEFDSARATRVLNGEAPALPQSAAPLKKSPSNALLHVP
jgi:aerobic C4-dicarboxylate transport protein